MRRSKRDVSATALRRAQGGTPVSVFSHKPFDIDAAQSFSVKYWQAAAVVYTAVTGA